MFNFYIQRHVNIKDDVLSGLTVALALIPEAVAFSLCCRRRTPGWFICSVHCRTYHGSRRGQTGNDIRCLQEPWLS